MIHSLVQDIHGIIHGLQIFLDLVYYFDNENTIRIYSDKNPSECICYDGERTSGYMRIGSDMETTKGAGENGLRIQAFHLYGVLEKKSRNLEKNGV